MTNSVSLRTWQSVSLSFSVPNLLTLPEGKCSLFSKLSHWTFRKLSHLSAVCSVLWTFSRTHIYVDCLKRSHITCLSNDLRFKKGHCLVEGLQASFFCLYGRYNRRVKIIMNHWRNDPDRRVLKYVEKNLSQCHFVHHKSHITLTWIQTRVSAPTVRLPEISI
jgi:hypothetical protein